MKLFKGSRKYFTIFFVCLALVLAAGFYSPIVIENKQNNWGFEVKEMINSIESSISLELNTKQRNLLRNFSLLETQARSFLLKKDSNTNNFLENIDKSSFSNYTIEILNSKEEIIFWNNSIPFSEKNFFPLKYNPGEIHFYNSALITYLTVFDSIIVDDTYWIVLSFPVEKHYTINNSYYKNISLESDFSKNFSSTFEIDYSPLAQKSNDGRKYSFEILNNYNKKIGIITFDKPSRDVELNRLKDFFANVQALLIIIGIVFLGFGFWDDFKLLKNKKAKILIVIIFLIAFRFLLFVLKFPSRFLEGSLTNSSFFASTFGYGIVRSPIEFFITAVVLLTICIIIYENVKNLYFNEKNHSIYYYLKFSLLTLLSIFLFFVLLRGLGASIKSVIFDSSLRYFKEPGLIPNFPTGFMEFNIFLVGLSSILISITIVLILLKYFPNIGNEKIIKRFYWILFLLFQIAGYLYDHSQRDPQGTPLIRILYIVFIFIIAYRIYFKSVFNKYNYVYFSLLASLVTINLLNYYNTLLERESLKTTALELTRTNDNLLEFLIRETLSNSSSENDIIRSFKNSNVNFISKAFLIWSQSSLQRENLNSSITLLNKEKQLLGSFGIGIKEKYRISPNIADDNINEARLDKYQLTNGEGTFITGIIPVKDGDVTLGFISASILYNPENYRLNNYPQFLSADYNPINSTVDFNNLKIFDFKEGKLVNVFGDITPANEHISNIVENIDLQKDNEAWSNININNEDYITYSLKVNEGGESRIIAVLLKEKNISWSLYNFLKVFFIHSLIIGLVLFIIFILQLKKERNIKYSFRTQLLIAFLLVSIFPIVFLAFYNKSITSQKNSEYIIDKLKERASIIEEYIIRYSEKNPERKIDQAFVNSYEDLNLDFSIFHENRLFYSSYIEFYDAGLLPDKINPLIYSKLKNEGYKEFTISENLDEYFYNTFYNKVSINDTTYILKINDAFNIVPIQLTGEEANIFLFGSYSLAVLLVIIFSAVMANRISSPIRSLTNATASVASGDLDYEVKLTTKGEIKNLINGFNYMIKELKKNQIELTELEREIAWKEMARQVAHEIKNPLTPMKLAVQQLVIAYKDKSNKFDMIFEKVTHTVISQIETLNNIASEFSSFARMPNIKLENLEVNSVVDDAVNLFIEEKIEIKIIKKEASFIIAADRDQLKRTIINLIRNSIQAGSNKIVINIAEDQNLINLEISDNGSGISPEHLEHIFAPNFTTKEKGMGLGLKMAKKFIESVKGKICIIESNQNGTKILIQFPKVIV